jgi:hypothetical protein
VNFTRAVEGYWLRLSFALRPGAPVRSSSFLAHAKSQLARLRAELSQMPALLLRDWQFWTVLTCAVAVMTLMQANVPLWYFGGDHADYYWYARYLLGDRTYPIPRNWRTPGMGIFHILSGTIVLDTWKGFIALFAAFSIAIPVCFYLIVKPYSRALALVAGLVVTFSMMPYMYATQAGSDHVYFFLHALFLLLCVAYFHRQFDQRLVLPLSIALVAAFANMVRPVGAILFWVFILVAGVSRPRDWRRLAATSGLYIALMTAWMVWDREWGTNGGLGPGLGYPLANDLATTAERRLAEAYFSTRGLVHAATDEAAGAHSESAKLRSVLHSALAARPQDWQTSAFLTPASLFGRYARVANGHERLLDALFSDRNTLYFGFIVQATKKSLGEDAGLALIERVAGEHGTTGARGWTVYFLRNPSQLALGVTPNLGGRTLFATYFRAREYPHRTFSRNHIPGDLPSPAIGPANARMLAIIRQFIDDNIAYPSYWPAGISEDWRDKPQALYEQILGDDLPIRVLLPRGLDPEQFFYNVLNWYLGPAATGQLYGEAAREIVLRYPALLTVHLDNLLHLLGINRYFDYGKKWDRRTLALQSDAYADERVQVIADLTPGLVQGLVPVTRANAVFENAAALHTFVYLLSPLFLVLLITALPFLRSWALLPACLLLLFDYAFQLLSIAAFTPWSAMRYEASFYLLPLIVGCMIFGQAISARQSRAVPPATPVPQLPLLSGLVSFATKAGVVLLVVVCAAAYVERVFAERVDALRKIGGPGLWAGLEQMLARAADPQNDLSAEQKRQTLANVQVLVARWRPFIAEAQMLFSPSAKPQQGAKR